MSDKPVPFSKRARYRTEAALIRVGIALLTLMPRRMVLGLAWSAAWVGFLVAPRPRSVAIANLDVAFGDEISPARKRQIARRSFQNLAMTMTSLLHAHRVTPKKLDAFCTIDESHLAELKQSGQAVIIITPHYGNWEILGLKLAAAGYPLTVIAQDMPNTQTERILAELRSVTGNRVISQQAATIKLYRALRRGEWTAALTDLNAPRGGGGVWIDFFGLPVYNNSSVAWLAIKTRAAVMGCAAVPLPGGRVDIRVTPIAYETTDDLDADVARLSAACLGFCEEVVRRDPDHWLWTYKRWKRRPHAEQGQYPFYSTQAPQPKS